MMMVIMIAINNNNNNNNNDNNNNNNNYNEWQLYSAFSFPQSALHLLLPQRTILHSYFPFADIYMHTFAQSHIQTFTQDSMFANRTFFNFTVVQPVKRNSLTF